MTSNDMSFDLPSWILVLVSLKNQVTTEINLKSSQNAYEMYKFGDLCNLIKKTGKNLQTELCQKVDFRPNLHEICSCYGNGNNDRHTISRY